MYSKEDMLTNARTQELGMSKIARYILSFFLLFGPWIMLLAVAKTGSTEAVFVLLVLFWPIVMGLVIYTWRKDIKAATLKSCMVGEEVLVEVDNEKTPRLGRLAAYGDEAKHDQRFHIIV